MKNKRRNSRIIIIVLLTFFVVALAVASIVLWTMLSDYGARKMGTDEKIDDEQTAVTQVEEDTLPKNVYKADGFYQVNDIRFYYADGYEGIAGIDVSSYQKDIDWNAVKHAGIEFAMIRIGYRGWSTGELDLDDCFYEHIEGAIDAGLDVGVYFFSQALNQEEAVEEAEFTLETIKGYNITCPVVFDWEEVDAVDARTNEMNMLLLTSCAQAFCQTVENAGYDAAVYFNQTYGYSQLNLESLKEFDFWLAEYADSPTFVYDFLMWQYTNEGLVPGIEGNVDLNIMFRKKHS